MSTTTFPTISSLLLLHPWLPEVGAQGLTSRLRGGSRLAVANGNLSTLPHLELPHLLFNLTEGVEREEGGRVREGGRERGGRQGEWREAG